MLLVLPGSLRCPQSLEVRWAVPELRTAEPLGDVVKTLHLTCEQRLDDRQVLRGSSRLQRAIDEAFSG